MDYFEFLEQFDSKSCVLSVETYEDGTYGNICVLTGNSLFKNDIEELTKQPFIDNTPYYMSLPKDLNFEDFIYRSAVLHQSLHTYVNLSQMGLWVEMYLSPLKSDKKNTGYCLYSYILSPCANEKNMSDLSPETSSKVLSACIKFRGSEDFLKTVNEVASDIRTICGAHKCTILTLDKERENCDIIGDSHAYGGSTFLSTDEVRREFYKMVCTWEDIMGGSSCFIVKNDRDMDILKNRNPEWYRSLRSYGVESMVLFPLKYKGMLLGYIWATNFDVKNTVKIKEILELTTFFIASEIANYKMLKQLEMIGTIDVLTGSLNRNSMNDRVAKLAKEKDENVKTLGVVFADLNGLKLINDRDGHLEGDRSLKRAAALLRQVFVDDEIYRAGGDEFMVLVLNNSQKEFDGKVQKIYGMAQVDVNTCFAVGSSFEDKDIDIRKALGSADEKMYEDKKRYYSLHPEMKYR